MLVDTSLTGYANGKREYSSTIVNMYGLLVDGIGPLKSIEIRSKGCVALIKIDLGGW